MDKNARIFVAGHRGMVGSALVRRLAGEGYRNIITRTKSQLDLTDQVGVNMFFEKEGIDVVLLAAAKVGGILANSTLPASFIYENLTIETNVIHAACRWNVSKLVFFGSSCIYPKACPQPIKEEYLLTSALEPTNEAYAIAKIAGDSTLTVWGSGTPRREFLHVDDLAGAAVFLMESGHNDGVFNVGVGEDLSIHELAETVCRVVGFQGQLVFDASKPDGTMRKLLDVSKLGEMGWVASTGLEQGIRATYQDFLQCYEVLTQQPAHA